MKLFSPAKVNLSLAVVGKRDGFHLLETIVQTISLGDWIDLELSSTDSLQVDPAILPPENTLSRALQLFRAQTGWIHPVSIRLVKQIPMEAGLGGGSSNGATLLWGLNQLSGCTVPESTLASWSATLGSDCALFFCSGSALLRGRGEQVQPHPPHTEPFWVVKPPYGLSTPAVYGALHPSEWSGQLRPHHNDLEAPALRLAPQLAQLRRQLLALGFDSVRLTGSGSALLCFGTADLSAFPAIQYWRVHPIQRSSTQWYS
jgi:4-diphosphocytidyl-2-C-methyl-D-erythritol kinase